MIDKIAENSKAQGFARSRLSEFTPADVEYIKGTSDFYGQNFYSSRLVYRNDSIAGMYPIPSYLNDIYAVRYQPDEWIGSSVSDTSRVSKNSLFIIIFITKMYNGQCIPLRVVPDLRTIFLSQCT